MDTAPTTSTRKRTRLAIGCASCRAKHLKCDAHEPRCYQCRIANSDCDRAVKLRFKYEINSGNVKGPAFPPDQRWCETSRPLRFYDETYHVLQYYEDVEFGQHPTPGTFIDVTREFNASKQLLPGRNQDDNFHSMDFEARDKPWLSAGRHSPSHARPDGSSKAVAVIPMTNFGSQADILFSERSPASLPSYHSSSIHLTPHQEQFEPFTDREADLMRNFTEHMASWVDVTDLERHFEIEVPTRALSNTMLRYAIFSLSARHTNRNRRDVDSTEALRYRNKALQLLIPQLSGPVEGLTEEHLAAVVILRLDEEMDVDDNLSHLTGATKILNSSASFISSGGLGEACAWLCLRQDIHIAIDSRQPLRTSIENFERSLWLQKENDISWANRVVLLVARILTIAFLDRSAERMAGLRLLSDQVEDWNNNKPLSFKPIKTMPRDRESGQRFPTIWMLSPFHVLGMQFYHIAKIVLLLSIDPDGRSQAAFENYHQSRKTEKTLREHLLVILGLAISNPRAETGWFHARHALKVWGGVLRHELDQGAAADFLRSLQVKTGWNTTRIIGTLQEYWHEDD